jgi:E-phenylitaconyl-CoA hydratase
MTPESSNRVRYEVSGAVATVTFNRPEKLNAMPPTMHHELMTAVRRFNDDDERWICVIRAEGRSFCAGRDIRYQADTGESPTKHADPGVGLYALPPTDKILITAARGHAIGVGGYIFMGGDVRLASRTLRFALLEVPTAVLGPYWLGAAERLPRAIAFRLAMGDEITVDEVERLGLATEVVDDGDLEEATHRWVDHLLELPPQHVLATKRLMNRVEPFKRDEMMRWSELHVRSQLDPLDDTREAAVAFVERRKPVWTGH